MAKQAQVCFHSTPRIRAPLYLFHGVMGGSLGLYWNIYGAILFETLSASMGGKDTEFWGLSPLRWTALIFVLGLALEMVFEIVTGVFADGLGRKFCIVSSLILRALFFVVLIWLSQLNAAATPLVIVVGLLAVAIFAVHYTLQSGSFDAWLADSLDEQAGVQPGQKLTNEEEDQRAELLASLHFEGEICYDACQLLGTLAGVYLYFVLELPMVAFVCGCAVSFFAAGSCGLYMRENRGLGFARMKDMMSRQGGQVTRQMWKMIWVAGGRFARNIRLWAAVGVLAAATSLVYVVGYVWILFSKERFPDEFKKYWVVFVAVFIMSSLLGSLATSWWLRRHKYGYVTLVWLTFGLNLAFALPVVVAWQMIPGASGPVPGGPFLFLALMAAHSFFAGPTRATGKALRNALIPPGDELRATILSWGEAVKNLVIFVLVVVGVGADPGSLRSWVWPALAAIGASFVMVVVLLRGRHTVAELTPANGLTTSTAPSAPHSSAAE